jgi:hypothetical protein
MQTRLNDEEKAMNKTQEDLDEQKIKDHVAGLTTEQLTEILRSRDPSFDPKAPVILSDGSIQKKD